MTSIRCSVAACVLLTLLIVAPAVAATLTVNSTADDGTGACTVSKCTLRDAIARSVSGDTIIFSLPAKSTITLASAELLINKNLIISGPGPNLLTVQRSTASGTPSFRIFSINGSFNVTISGLTIANGSVFGSAGGGFNGGIANSGTLTITNSTISGNGASNSGGGIGNSGTLTITNSTISGNGARSTGGGIGNSGTLTITNSTISDNSADGGGLAGGGGIYNQGTLTITNSTISGNSAVVGGGGGIINSNSLNNLGTMTISNSTLSGNSARYGGGIYNEGSTVNARNTIIAKNTDTSGAPDFQGTLTSQGYNLIGNTIGTGINGTTTGNQLNVDPLLDTLKDNGGPTKTHALLSGSTAIDKGHSGGSGIDQRGFSRPVDDPGRANAIGGDGSDIGAYEVSADQLPGCNTVNRIVRNNDDSGTDSLRAVIANVCAGSTITSTITFAPNVTGAINLTSGELLINKSLTINGPGANVLTVQRSASAGNFRIFNIRPNTVTATISGLTIANGNAPDNGGGISNTGTLTIANATISRNLAGGSSGGGIVSSKMLTILNSTISDNSATAGFGGGIYNAGTLDVTSSTISGNSVTELGIGIGVGGGISNQGATTITNSTIAGNTAQFRGGGIWNATTGTLKSSNSIIAPNASPSGPDVFGPLTSQGDNLIGNSAGATISSTVGDQIGTAGAPIDPLLGPLQDNGGPTPTRALLAGSPAIDKGHSNGLTTDQRGYTRPLGVAAVRAGDGSDIGAFEVQEPVVVVEFYNASLDHYFITWLVDEIAKLDAGTVIKGWTRTGQTFMTYTSPQSGTSPVCRYYIPPGLGDSHFFGRGSDECNATGQKNPSFVLEATAFMQMFLPLGGNCPAGTMQVYRVFSNRLDANHRYMILKAIRDQMAALGWLVEGDGPDAVVMCAPE